MQMTQKARIFFLGLFFATLSSPAIAQDILPPTNNWKGKSESLLADKTHPWVTPSELSNLTESPDYPTTVEWLTKLCEASEYLQLTVIGKSEQNRDIIMVVASRKQTFAPEEIANSKSPTLLFQGGIHAGEIDGKDAGMMLLRDIAFGDKGKLLKDANLLFIPVLNVDGHERRSEFARVNQRGPKVMGWRTNANNLNLNRDYAKAETAGIQAVIGVINQYKPDLYLDIHVTDGADYQYDITYGFVDESGHSPQIANWLSTELKPEVNDALKAQGHIPGPLMFAVNGKDFSEGNIEFPFSPRFSNTYGDTRHLPTILVENHSLKPFKQRVLGTYVFIEACIGVLGSSKKQLEEAIQTDEMSYPNELILKFGYNSEVTDSMRLKGIQAVKNTSNITGEEYVRWTGIPEEKTIPIVKMNKPLARVKMAKTYWIPAEWNALIQNLKVHGVQMEIIENPIEITGEQYFISDYKMGEEPYEGHWRMEDVQTISSTQTVTMPVGSARISTQQPLGQLITLLLEPKSPDSYLQWGYMLSILQRTEYIEGYVLEPLMEQLLEKDDQLRKVFMQKMVDPAFSQDAQKIYQWIYSKSPYFDQQWKMYPVLRVN